MLDSQSCFLSCFFSNRETKIAPSCSSSLILHIDGNKAVSFTPRIPLGVSKGRILPHVTSHQKYSGKGPCSIAVLCVTSAKGHRSIGLLGARLHCMGGGMTIVVLWTVSLPHTTQHNTVLVCLTCQGTKHASYRLGLPPKVICNRSCLKIKTFVSLFYCFRE